MMLQLDNIPSFKKKDSKEISKNVCGENKKKN